ncbi:TPA: YHYH domain-containing protein [Clostridioides difficile]
MFKKKLIAVIMSLTIISIGSFSYAHSGRTDSSGGHRDNKNKSGLGSYHYHCGGYPAHLEALKSAYDT